MKKIKEQFFYWRSYICTVTKNIVIKIYKKVYPKLKDLKDWVGIYEKIIRPLYLVLRKILQWVIPIIIACGEEANEKINEYLEALHILL